MVYYMQFNKFLLLFQTCGLSYEIYGIFSLLQKRELSYAIYGISNPSPKTWSVICNFQNFFAFSKNVDYHMQFLEFLSLIKKVDFYKQFLEFLSLRQKC